LNISSQWSAASGQLGAKEQCATPRKKQNGRGIGIRARRPGGRTDLNWARSRVINVHGRSGNLDSRYARNIHTRARSTDLRDLDDNRINVRIDQLEAGQFALHLSLDSGSVLLKPRNLYLLPIRYRLDPFELPLLLLFE